MKVLFLDFDGVINNTPFMKQSKGQGASQLDPANLAVLDKIIQATGAKIVISSSWRHMFSVWEMKNMMFRAGSKVASKQVIDRTPMGEDNRGMEIQEWLQLDSERMIVNPEHEPVDAWVIIDDVDEFLPEQKPHFVQTDASTGLTDNDAAEAIAILRMRR